MIYVFIFITGVCLGSFYACIGYRIPNKISTVKPSSFCPNCKNSLKWYMNIPLLSYIFLKGKCAYCKEKISITYFLIELTTGILFLISYMIFGLNYQLIVVLTLISALMVSLVTDLKYYYISDRVIVVSSILVAFTYLKFLGVNSFLSHILSGALMFILMYLLKIITTKILKKESLGDGDIKLMILIGLTLGVFNSFISLFISSVTALIYTILFIKKKDALIPFGPFLLIGAIVTYILVFYQITII